MFAKVYQLGPKACFPRFDGLTTWLRKLVSTATATLQLRVGALVQLIHELGKREGQYNDCRNGNHFAFVHQVSNKNSYASPHAKNLGFLAPTINEGASRC